MIRTDDTIVVAEFHEAQIHGQITIVASHWSSRKYSHLLKQYCLPVYLSEIEGGPCVYKASVLEIGA